MFLYFCEDLEKYYKKTGISEDILLDTLSDIVVWTKIHFRINKKIGLSETHWLVRHLSGRLFKLGRLQFCMESEEIEVHIQEGASIDEKNVTNHLKKQNKGAAVEILCRLEVRKISGTARVDCRKDG